MKNFFKTLKEEFTDIVMSGEFILMFSSILWLADCIIFNFHIIFLLNAITQFSLWRLSYVYNYRINKILKNIIFVESIFSFVVALVLLTSI